MKGMLIKKQEAEEMDMVKSLEAMTVCELRRISPSEVKSKHVIVCITGFLQED